MRKFTWKRAALIALCVFLSLVLMLMVAVTVYVERLTGKIDRVWEDVTLSAEELEDLFSETDPTATGPTMNEEDVDWGSTGEEIIKTENVINILLIGQDRRPGQARQRSDAMILCTVNKEKRTITLTSFMRDMYVKIPGYKNNKINASYAAGGMSLLNSTLKENFGVQVDGNVEVDFDGFMELVDIMGGVDITLTKAEADCLNRRGNWDVEENQHWQLQEGLNRLNGSQALAYSRIRYIGNGDYQRTERQRTVLTELFRQLQNMSLGQANQLLNTAVELISTDMTNQEIFGYAADLLPLMSGFEVITQRIPASGTYQDKTINGAAVLVVDFDENRALLEQTLGE